MDYIVKIKKCSNNEYWYREYIGCYAIVEDVGKTRFLFKRFISNNPLPPPRLKLPNANGDFITVWIRKKDSQIIFRGIYEGYKFKKSNGFIL